MYSQNPPCTRNQTDQSLARAAGNCRATAFAGRRRGSCSIRLACSSRHCRKGVCDCHPRTLWSCKAGNNHSSQWLCMHRFQTVLLWSDKRRGGGGQRQAAQKRETHGVVVVSFGNAALYTPTKIIRRAWLFLRARILARRARRRCTRFCTLRQRCPPFPS